MEPWCVFNMLSWAPACSQGGEGAGGRQPCLLLLSSHAPRRPQQVTGERQREAAGQERQRAAKSTVECEAPACLQLPG